MEYFDKNGKQILQGMTLVHDDGEEEKVFECGDEDDLDLGFDANNYDSPHLQTLMFYPLSQFDLSEYRMK